MGDTHTVSFHSTYFWFLEFFPTLHSHLQTFSLHSQKQGSSLPFPMKLNISFAITSDSSSWRRVYTKNSQYLKALHSTLTFKHVSAGSEVSLLRFSALKPTIILSNYSHGFPPNSAATEESISATLSLHFSDHCCY